QHDVESRGHAHHADDGEQKEGIVLTVVFALQVEIANRHQYGDGGPSEEEVEEVDRETIDQKRAHETEPAHQLSLGVEPALAGVEASTFEIRAPSRTVRAI